MASTGPRRRRSTANELVVIYWRDIPAQVTATSDGDKGSWLLDERFQVAIDRAAAVAGLTDADDYVHQWRRESRPIAGEPAAAARAEAERLQDLYPSQRVRELVANGGLDPEPGSASAPPSENATGSSPPTSRNPA